MRILGNYFGFFVAVLLCAVLVGCGKVPPPPPAEVSSERGPVVVPKISGEAALAEVRDFVALGPREAGTPGAERAVIYLHERLTDLGIRSEIQEFRAPSPRGETTFRNVIGRLEGTSERIIMIASHYDTKAGIPGFVGANDSGSSTGLLLELARAFSAAAPPAHEIQFVFFDGEECLLEYGPHDGFHGSRYLAEKMEAAGQLSRITAFILLDMVGDRDLTVTLPRNCTRELVARTFTAAHTEGVRRQFQLVPSSIGDDHVAFFERGVPAIDIIDFIFGSSPGKNDYWHTAEDTMDKLSAESLDAVGRVTARLVANLLATDETPAR